MRTQSYEEMVKEYESRPIDADDLNERKEILSRQGYSVIVEGGFLEFDNADKWINENLHIDSISSMFYGKTGYDFGFMEYFFDNEAASELFRKEVTHIYTVYPDGSYTKSDGYDKDIPFNEL